MPKVKLLADHFFRDHIVPAGSVIDFDGVPSKQMVVVAEPPKAAAVEAPAPVMKPKVEKPKAEKPKAKASSASPKPQHKK